MGAIPVTACVALLLLLAGIGTPSIAGVDASADVLDAQPCTWLIGSDKAKPVPRFPVVPGGGWDNLRNREMGPVADLTLSRCALSVDGSYVLPNQVIAYPVKESRDRLVSKIFRNYWSYTSSTSRTINAGSGRGLLGGLFAASGTYSQEYKEVKKAALVSGAQIGRTQLRYNRYLARVKPDFRLSKAFRNRLLDIGKSIVSKRRQHARYLSDLLVRDFGTHVVTSLNAGGVVEKVDFFKYDSLSQTVYTENKLSQCMSVDFLLTLKADFSVGLGVSTEELAGYRASLKKTSVNAFGGSTMGINVNLTQWRKSLSGNLVAIDREGQFLHTVIRARSLPGFSTPYLMALVRSVKSAIVRYYKMNAVRGCMDPNSPNFDPLANLRGSCLPPVTRFAFGGVYQTCEQIGRPKESLCGQSHSPVQPNYATGGYQCPDGYQAAPLLTITGYSQSAENSIFRRKEAVRTVLKSYWCAAQPGSQLPSQSGLMYGGAYSPKFVNPATGSRSCGRFYRPYRVGRDITLCLSADMTYAKESRIPLGGFFSCQNGNPLAARRRGPIPFPFPRPGVPRRPGSVRSPKRCPTGFTQGALDVVDGCELMQCTAQLTTAKPGKGGRPVRLPPYEARSAEWRILDASSSTSLSYPMSAELTNKGGGKGKSGLSIAAMVGALVACVAAVVVATIAVVVAVAAVHKRRSARGLYMDADAPEIDDRRPLLAGEARRAE